MSRFTVDSARTFLKAGDVFHEADEDDAPESRARWEQTLNMNDVWAWALADCHYVPDDKLVEVADLFWRYGWCGVLYFVSKETGDQRSEFLDNNRFIDFVRNEAQLCLEVPDSSKRAYQRLTYVLGDA